MEVYGYLRSMPCGIQRAMCFRKFRSALTSHSQEPQSFLSLVSFPSLALPLLCALHKVPCQPTAPLLRHALRKFHSTWPAVCYVPGLPSIAPPGAKEGPFCPSSPLCPFSLPTPCALHNVLCLPQGMCYALGESTALGARGGNLTFPPVCPPFARVLEIAQGYSARY